MKTWRKYSGKILLLFIFLLLVAFMLLILSVFGWVQTYNSFTRRTLVAEVSMSKLKQDKTGPYVDVKYDPVQDDAKTKYFKVYGDTVYIGGPLVKFYDNLILINFNSIYKITSISGQYNFTDPKIAAAVPRSKYILNGGSDETWRSLNEKEDTWPYNMFVEATYFSNTGEPASLVEAKKYKIYAKQDGFSWIKIE